METLAAEPADQGADIHELTHAEIQVQERAYYRYIDRLKAA